MLAKLIDSFSKFHLQGLGKQLGLSAPYSSCHPGRSPCSEKLVSFNTSGRYEAVFATIRSVSRQLRPCS